MLQQAFPQGNLIEAISQLRVFLPMMTLVWVKFTKTLPLLTCGRLWSRESHAWAVDLSPFLPVSPSQSSAYEMVPPEIVRPV